MSTSNHLLHASISLALLSLAATAGAGAQPQQQRQAQADDPAGLEEIVVTGTRIVRRDLETSGPVTTFSRDELEISGRRLHVLREGASHDIR